MGKKLMIPVSLVKDESFKLLHDFSSELKFVFYESLYLYREEQYRNQNLGLYNTAAIYQGMVECCYRSIASINKLENELKESFSKRLDFEAIFNKAFEDSTLEKLI